MALESGGVRLGWLGRLGLRQMAGKEFWMTHRACENSHYKVNVIPQLLQRNDGGCVPRARHVLGTSHTTYIISFAHHNRLIGSYHDCPHMTGEETEAQRNEGTCPGHRAVKWGDRFELRQGDLHSLAS